MEIKAAVLSVCVISAVKFIIGQTAGGLKMKDQLKTMLDILLAVVLITPFVNGVFHFELPEISAYEFEYSDTQQEIYNKALAQQTAGNVEDILSQQISAAGIELKNISAEVNISSDGSISITKVTVTTEDFEAASVIVKNSIGWETEVINGSGEEFAETAEG